MAALRALNFGTPDLGQVSILVRKLLTKEGFGQISSKYTWLLFVSNPKGSFVMSTEVDPKME